MTDIEIANSIKPKKIIKIAKKLGLKPSNLICFGDYIAKVKSTPKSDKQGKLILVTAINPTPAGIGKTTVSIGLADSLNKLGKKASLALREPSLGPVFGIKGGATGGGLSQVIPMEDINLHFTGDFHSITTANNLLASMIDNHIYQGNELNIDENRIMFHRCLDLNDRALRQVTVGQTKNETSRQDNFTITAASEIMAIMCLASDINDLKNRLGNILVAISKDDNPIYARDLKIQDAMAILLKDSLRPNLVQTLGHTPAFVHMGPFANIAHGCNSNIATKLSLSLSDYTITEAGFGADLGAEKFLDIKCRVAVLKPNAVVLVATIQALKFHGGMDKENLKKKNLTTLKSGLKNLLHHIHTIRDIYHLPLVVTLNKYSSDTIDEINLVALEVEKLGVRFAINDAWGQGAKGTLDLAREVISACSEDNSEFDHIYKLEDSIESKIEQIATKIYGARKVILEKKAKESLKMINKCKLDNLPIVIAKTQYSLSDDPKAIGVATDFDLTIRDLEIRSGAGFIVAIAGNMMLMPGLSKEPAGTKMAIDNSYTITGLF